MKPKELDKLILKLKREHDRIKDEQTIRAMREWRRIRNSPGEPVRPLQWKIETPTQKQS